MANDTVSILITHTICFGLVCTNHTILATDFTYDKQSVLQTRRGLNSTSMCAGIFNRRHSINAIYFSLMAISVARQCAKGQSEAATHWLATTFGSARTTFKAAVAAAAVA